MLFRSIFALLLLTFRDYSISNDEEVQHRCGEMVVAYYTSGFTDRSLFGYKNLYLYGALFDIAGVLIGYIAPVDVFAVRHLLCAMTGLGGIVATWAVARLIAGPRAALLAAMTLAVCGAWYGPMFNHTKDIPFAAAMIGATYFLLRACRDLPRPRLTDVLLLGLLMGAALGQRALGLLLIGYVAIAIVLHTPGPFAPAEATRFFCRSLLRFTAAFVLAYVIMIAAWPWSALELFNPIRAIFDFTHFKYPIKTLLFEIGRAHV